MIYTFLADGFEETEMIFPLDLIRRAGLEIKTVSVSGEKTVYGSHGIGIVADMTVKDKEYRPETAEMLILPGGMPGTNGLFESREVAAALDSAFADGRFIAAICAAPSVLGRRNYLRGKEAVCYPGFEKYLYGRKETDKRCVRDGNIITAVGAGAAEEFGLLIVETLCGKEVSDKLKVGILAYVPE